MSRGAHFENVQTPFVTYITMKHDERTLQITQRVTYLTNNCFGHCDGALAGGGTDKEPLVKLSYFIGLDDDAAELNTCQGTLLNAESGSTRA